MRIERTAEHVRAGKRRYSDACRSPSRARLPAWTQ